MSVEIAERQAHEGRARHDRHDRDQNRGEHQHPEQWVPPLTEAQPDPGSPAEAAAVAATNPQQHVHHAARPLKLLGHTVGERFRPVPMCLGVDSKDPLPPVRTHHQRGREVLPPVRVPGRRCRAAPRSVPRSGNRCNWVHIRRYDRPGLDRAVPPRRRGARGPTTTDLRSGRRYWGCDVAHQRVAERDHHVAQVVARRHVIGIELRHDVVMLIAPCVVEEGQVSSWNASGAATIR